MAFEWLEDALPYAGAAVGAAFGGPAGAAIGYGAGNLVGDLVGGSDSDAVTAAQQRKEAALAKIQAKYAAMKEPMVKRREGMANQQLGQFQGAANALATLYGGGSGQPGPGPAASSTAALGPGVRRVQPPGNSGMNSRVPGAPVPQRVGPPANQNGVETIAPRPSPPRRPDMSQQPQIDPVTGQPMQAGQRSPWDPTGSMY